MKLQKYTVILIASLLVVALATLSSLRGQNPQSQSNKEQQTNDNPFPIVDFAKDKVQHERDVRREAKGKRYNNGGVVENDSGLEQVSRSSNWSFNVSELPSKISDVIIVATVTDAQAHLSPDNNGIYSEFTVKVDEVLKDDKSPISVGSSISVDREGGRVRYPSGKLITYFIEGQGMPRVSKRYVLFLKREEDNLSIITGYELQGGKARPLDYPQKFKKLEGVSEDTLLNQIRDVISPSSNLTGTGR